MDGLGASPESAAPLPLLQTPDSYGYDPLGRQTSVTYPSNLTINNNVDFYGYLTSITEGTSGPTLYTVNNMNGFGQATNYTLGNGKTTSITTDFGAPTGYYTDDVFKLALGYDNTTGDYTTRTQESPINVPVTLNTESFAFDGLDRITSAALNGGTSVNFTYYNDGNIATKPAAGEYSYDAEKLNAVTQVSNPDNVISSNAQNITYIGFNKASTITENGYTLNYSYDAGYNRKYSECTQTVGTLISTIYTRVYSGNYEVNTDQTSDTKLIHYVYGNNSLVAMVVIDQATEAKSEYYTYTDHLGSILTVTDDEANIIASQNFDAWGRNRDPGTWTYPWTPPSGFPNWLYRGYCGHEMLPQFGLINMNGRMYDPILGRMLSPDNNVADDLSTQGYNRYSYVANNPLRYTDPTGWLLHPSFPSLQSPQYGFAGGDPFFWYAFSTPVEYWGAGWGVQDPIGYAYGGGYANNQGEQVQNGSNLISSSAGVDPTLLASAGGGIPDNGVGYGNSLLSGPIVYTPPPDAPQWTDIGPPSPTYSNTSVDLETVTVTANAPNNPWRWVTGDIVSGGANFGFISPWYIGGSVSIDFNWILYGPQSSWKPSLTVTPTIAVGAPGASLTGQVIRYNLINSSLSLASATNLQRNTVLVNSFSGDYPAFNFSAGAADGLAGGITGSVWNTQNGYYLVGVGVFFGGGTPGVILQGGASNTYMIHDFYGP